MLHELGWPIVEERDIGRGDKEGAAMEDARVDEMGQRLTDARNQLDVMLSVILLEKFDRAQVRQRAQAAKAQVEACLAKLREEGFTIDVGG
jgi:hypothetical protein